MDDELLCLFINESREHLVTIEADLLAIEEAGASADTDLINKVFRAAHSIKGTSGFFGLNKVKDLAHKAETVLDMLRSGMMTSNAEITNLLLAAFDRLREMINKPNESETEDTSELTKSLSDLASSYMPTEKKASLTETMLLNPKGGGAPVSVSKLDYEMALAGKRTLFAVEYDLIHDIERHGKNVLDVFRGLWSAGEILDCTLDFAEIGTLDDVIGTELPLQLIFAANLQTTDLELLFPHNLNKVRELILASDGAEKDHSVSTMPIPAEIVEAAAPKSQSSTQKDSTAVVVEDSIRVNIGVLERLMNLAGELVLGRNQLRASISRKNSRALAAADQRINQITAELQDVIMQTRLQPIGNVFARFPRVVRDLAMSLGKEIDLDIRGKDVALDNSLIEALSDPLTHMVRNAVDHGIELPEDRIREGKARHGTVIIDAHHEGGQVLVEIADDGRGIDAERIAQAAEAKGLISHEQLQKMSTQEKTALIFLPGLTTAKTLTDISGRGVGMDVVRTNLNHLGGQVEIVTALGKGTTFRIKLPLTLAIIPSLIISVGGNRFAIPQINVEELLRVHPGKTATRIEFVGETEVLVLRDQLIPIVRFAKLLGIDPDSCESRHPEETVKTPRGVAEGHTANALEIAVVTTGSQTYGLVVGGFHDTEEIVVKPLGCHLKDLREYSGATILGDGTVALILDVEGLATKAELGVSSGIAGACELGKASEQEKLFDTHSLVLFHNAPNQLCAVSLDTVTRIERIRPEQVETIGGRRTMQHRGGFLPLVTLSDVAQVDPIGDAKELAVMISSIRGHEVGLLGATPVDVIETAVKIDEMTHRQRGVAGSAIIRNRAALVVDLFELVDATWPEWAVQDAADRPQSQSVERGAILLAEDSDFFRSQLTRFLEEDGYTVLAAMDGEAAWDRLVENINHVRMVVTDIEMPRLDGLGLTRRIRADQRTAGLPIIAVTSLAGDEDVARGKAAGVNEYQTKLDRDNLLAGIQRFMTVGVTTNA